jgi:MinD superfamily P-loop ATPase
MAHKIDAANCVACGCCQSVCPAEAISAGDAYSIDPDKCLDCGACAAQCPNSAIAPA